MVKKALQRDEKDFFKSNLTIPISERQQPEGGNFSLKCFLDACNIREVINNIHIRELMN